MIIIMEFHSKGQAGTPRKSQRIRATRFDWMSFKYKDMENRVFEIVSFRNDPFDNDPL